MKARLKNNPRLVFLNYDKQPYGKVISKGSKNPKSEQKINTGLRIGVAIFKAWWGSN